MSMGTTTLTCEDTLGRSHTNAITVKEPSMHKATETIIIEDTFRIGHSIALAA
jgi:hypothetical protein